MNWSTVWIVWCVNFCKFLSLSWLPEQIKKIDPNLQPLYKKKRKIRDVWRSPSELQSNRCKPLYRVMAQASRGSDPLRRTWNQVPWAWLYKEFFHQTPRFRLPPSHTGRTTGALVALVSMGMGFLLRIYPFNIIIYIVLLYSPKFQF